MAGTLVTSHHFVANKYGQELLLDIGRIEHLKNYVLDTTPHRISFYELLFIESGTGNFLLDGQSISLEPGLVIFTSPGQIRQWRPEGGVRGYTLFFELDFLHLFFTDDLYLYRLPFFHQYQRPPSIALSAETGQLALSLLVQIENEILQLKRDSSHYLRALLYQLLVVLNRCYSAKYVHENSAAHPLLLRFRSLLEQHFMTHQQVGDYAALLRIGPARLNQICKQYTGFSVQQLIHQKQVSEIKRQLAGTSHTIAQIAYSFNFSDPSNFKRFFKKMTGLSPQQYRMSG